MRQKRILRVKQQTVRTQESRLMNDIINDLFNGQTPFARARRHRSGRAWTGQAGTESAGAGRAWTGLYPNTELDVDLKLVTQEQGRMELGEYLDGMITRDGEATSPSWRMTRSREKPSAATQASTWANGSTSSAEPTARSIRPSNGRRASGPGNLATMPSIRPASY